MSNSVICAVANAKVYKKWVSRPTFVSQKIFNKNLVAIDEIKPILMPDKPIFVSKCISNLGKRFMYDHHYNYIKVRYDHKAKLLFTNTDSLTCEIKQIVCINYYKGRDKFDFREYSENSRF